jgi:hypothetical protein|tara:strand:- start:24755 stop:25651 length:897 start_codon:yes stop_codon:yes gene_type:complete
MTINAIEAISRVRERIHDRDALSFGDEEILRAVDDSLRKVFTLLRTHGDSQSLQTASVPTSSLTQIVTNVHEWAVPGYVGDIQMIQLLRGGDDGPGFQVQRAGMEEMDAGRSNFMPGTHRTVWMPGPDGSAQLRGSLSGFSTMLVWYTMRIPPMLHGVQLSPSTTVITPTTVSGDYKARDGAYDGSTIEVVTSANAANTGQIRKVGTFLAGNFTLASAWPASVDALDTWSLVLPLADEYHEYLVAMATMTMLRRSADDDGMSLLQPELQHLQHAFESGISRHSSGEPPRFTSSRRRGL